MSKSIDFRDIRDIDMSRPASDSISATLYYHCYDMVGSQRGNINKLLWRISTASEMREIVDAVRSDSTFWEFGNEC